MVSLQARGRQQIVHRLIIQAWETSSKCCQPSGSLKDPGPKAFSLLVNEKSHSSSTSASATAAPPELEPGIGDFGGCSLSPCPAPPNSGVCSDGTVNVTLLISPSQLVSAAPGFQWVFYRYCKHNALTFALRFRGVLCNVVNFPGSSRPGTNQGGSCGGFRIF